MKTRKEEDTAQSWCLKNEIFIAVQEGLTANEKKFGTTNKRKQMADFMKDQKQVRKQSYASDTREAKSNEIWTGKEGLDGITQLPTSRKN